MDSCRRERGTCRDTDRGSTPSAWGDAVRQGTGRPRRRIRVRTSRQRSGSESGFTDTCDRRTYSLFRHRCAGGSVRLHVPVARSARCSSRTNIVHGVIQGGGSLLEPLPTLHRSCACALRRHVDLSLEHGGNGVPTRGSSVPVITSRGEPTRARGQRPASNASGKRAPSVGSASTPSHMAVVRHASNRLRPAMRRA